MRVGRSGSSRGKTPEHADRAAANLFHHSQQHEWTDSGALRIQLHGRSLGELALQLLPWAGKLIIEGPDALKDRVREAGKKVAEIVG